MGNILVKVYKKVRKKLSKSYEIAELKRGG